jgi:Restriction endonuclease.
MANFSKYLGKEERVLNSIDMKDETVWANNNAAASEYKSWTTLVITNKRLFSLSRRKLSMKEFRLEDIVSSGWTYRPQWGKILWGLVFLIAAILVYINIDAIGYYTAQLGAIYFGTHTDPDVVAMLTSWAFYGSIILAILSIICFFSYFLLKRTTLRMTTKDGREYMFLLRGRRQQIDDFRMAVQDAKDLYIEETENRYFDKMRTVLFDQSNYEYALKNAQATEMPISESETEKLKKEEYMLWERKNAKLSAAAKAEQIGASEQYLLPEIVMQLNSDGTLQLTDSGSDKFALNEQKQLGSGASSQLEFTSKLIEAPLSAKTADLFEQMGFEVSILTATDADLLLYKDNVRYVVIADEDEFGPITEEKIEKAIHAKHQYKTDIGLLVSAGDLTDEIQEYANQNNIKIVYIKKAE